LSNTTESNNTFLGANTNGAPGITNATAIGAGAVVPASDTMVLGTNAVTVQIPGALSVVGALNTATQYNIGGARALSVAGTFNAFFGLNAGRDNTTGQENTFIGHNAGRNNIGGSFNTFIGNAAGINNTTGNGNTFVGDVSGEKTTTGSNNSFFGVAAGRLNTTGGDNAFFGASAGAANTTGGGNANVGIGVSAPKAKLHLAGGDLYVSSSNQGVILKSPNGAVCRRLGIDDAGNIVLTPVTCP
jgi:hypothetical protein